MIAVVVLAGVGAAVAPAKAMNAVRAPSAIAIDGVLDDGAWRAAAPIADHVQKLPTYGGPPRYPMEIRVLYDGDAIYIGARMWNAPGTTRAVVTRRDETRDAERFIVSFDPYRTRRVAYSFAVTVAGVRADWTHTDDDEHERDMSWDPVWSAATRVLDDGWSAELRIPWSQLRYPDGEGAAWGVNFNRYDPDHNEDVFWIAVPRERTGWSSYMGELRGLAGLPRGMGIELLPYAAASVSAAESEGDVDPDANLGLDAKIGLGRGLTLDVAVNPDFGQVEADPAIVNLTAFEVSLPELRPFFVAGNEIFAGAPGHYFYSRRIGADPDRLLAAAKLSGRLGGRTTVGALAAATDDTTTSGDLTGWSVARVEREIGAVGDHVLGATAAVVVRRIDDEAAAQRPRGSLVAGVNSRHRWDDGAWEVGGATGISSIWGEATAIEAIQRTSTHYFQRPDADHVELDPTRTSFTGWHGRGHVSRRAGNLQGDVEANVESPEFDTNGTGILQSADEISSSANIGWSDTTPSARWLGWNVELNGFSAWNFAGDRRGSNVELDANGTTNGLLEMNGSVGYVLPALSDTLTRGGPLIASPAGVYMTSNLGASKSSIATWGVGVSAQHEPRGTTEAGFGGRVSMRPDPHVRIELAPHVSVSRDRFAYVATLPGGPAETFGERYLFATLARRDAVLVMRLELTLRPDLAIDCYVEPFVSTGAYTQLGQLTAARDNELRRYDSVARRGATVEIDDGGDVLTLDEPDFTVRSLRSTAVLRWEPRPGSTLYVVWQQSRGERELRAHALGAGLADAFTAPGAHTLALKLAWWFSR